MTTSGCLCGSGQPYLACCGSDEARQLRASQAAQQSLQQWHDDVQRWGYARPIVQVGTGAGHRFVVADSSIYAIPEHHTLHDFLLTHLRDRLGGPWANEVGGDDEHVLLGWLRELQEMKRATQADSPTKALRQTVPPPNVYDMLRLAYDLFSVRDAGLLEEALVKRLRAKNEFSPARYEVAVAACFIRAGFELTLLDPSKGIGRPCEFVAVSRDGSETYSVEAKSRQRPGVLGHPGPASPAEELRLDVDRLIRKAFKKDAQHERVVCVDVCLPPAPPGTLPTWLGDLEAMLGEMNSSAGLSAYVLATNSPNRFLSSQDIPLSDEAALAAVRMPMRGAEMMKVKPHLTRLLRAWKDGDRVPNSW